VNPDPNNKAQVYLRQRARGVPPGAVVWVDPGLLLRATQQYRSILLIGGVYFKPFELQDPEGTPI
jgi:hypothetical protein